MHLLSRFYDAPAMHIITFGTHVKQHVMCIKMQIPQSSMVATVLIQNLDICARCHWFISIFIFLICKTQPGI